ncbi:MAG: 67, gp67 [Acidimicrobiales bacterium]|nr:67, gp67 [Acidimicrobiales bacterium]
MRCGLGPQVRTLARLLLRALIPMGPVEAARLWQGPAWRSFVQACELEVNHVEPRLGRGYQAGCHHHLDGLETLCHRCHVQVTSAQHALGGSRADVAAPAVPPPGEHGA